MSACMPILTREEIETEIADMLETKPYTACQMIVGNEGADSDALRLAITHALDSEPGSLFKLGVLVKDMVVKVMAREAEERICRRMDV